MAVGVVFITFSILGTNRLVYIADHGRASNFSEYNQYVTYQNYPTECRNIYFLKIHKTGSTTFSSILYRFGIKRNLTFGFFSKGNFPSYLMADIIPHPVDLLQGTKHQHKINIIAVHTLLDIPKISAAMPNDTKYVTSLRHPFSQLKSAFSYFNLKAIFHLPNTSDPIQLFLRNPNKYLKQNIYSKLVHNMYALEFGFDMKRLGNVSYVKEYLSYLDKQFDSVIITEHFEESLLLLRDKFHWSYKDILYLSLREQTYAKKQARNESTTDSLEAVHRTWVPSEYMIYEYFLEKHQHYVALKGSIFHEELLYFQQLLKSFKEFCSCRCKNKWRNTSPLCGRYELVFNESIYHKEFLVNEYDCIQMMLGTTELSNEVARHQYLGYCRNMTHLQNGEQKQDSRYRVNTGAKTRKARTVREKVNQKKILKPNLSHKKSNQTTRKSKISKSTDSTLKVCASPLAPPYVTLETKLRNLISRYRNVAFRC